jgi:hypothetical protein
MTANFRRPGRVSSHNATTNGDGRPCETGAPKHGSIETQRRRRFRASFHQMFLNGVMNRRASTNSCVLQLIRGLENIREPGRESSRALQQVRVVVAAKPLVAMNRGGVAGGGFP